MSRWTALVATSPPRRTLSAARSPNCTAEQRGSAGEAERHEPAGRFDASDQVAVD
jgi:hypothetical protein